MRRILVAVVAVAIAGALALAVLAWFGAGPFASQPRQLSISPIEVRSLGKEGDPFVAHVMIPWGKDGYCSGQFAVSARETESAVVVSQVTGFDNEWAEPCAGLGTGSGLAWVPLMLGSPLGTRTVTRAVDGVVPPVSNPCERHGLPAWCPRSS